MESYTKCQAHPHAHSFFDPAGRLFWIGENLYRGITPEWSSFFEELFQKGIVQELVDQELLVETELEFLKIDGYEKVFSHRLLLFLSYPHEWCTLMYKDAALQILKLSINLNQENLTLIDPHPWNILFDGYKPLYVDFTSIRPIEPNSYMWKGHDDFCKFFFYPLILMSRDQATIARLLVYEGEGVRNLDISKFLKGLSSLRLTSLSGCLFSRLLAYLSHLNSKINGDVTDKDNDLAHSLSSPKKINVKIQLYLLKRIKRDIEKLVIPSFNYCIKDETELGPEQGIVKESVAKALNELCPSSVLVIGSTVIWPAELAASKGMEVVAFDKDDLRITQLYQRAKSKKLPILPLVMDFTKPTPSRGPSSHWSIAANERLKCDLVIALGLLSQAVESLYFDQITEGLFLFSKRWLIIEFIPPNDPEFVDKWWIKRNDWYTLDDLLISLHKRFTSVKNLLSLPNGRKLFLCEKQEE